jgi:hypothetical protein
MPMHFTREQIDQIGRIAAHASKLQDRCDAFVSRRAKRDADKAEGKADKARRDAESLDPSAKALNSATPDAPPDRMPEPRGLPDPWYFDDTHERSELRQGALSKQGEQT